MLDTLASMGAPIKTAAQGQAPPSNPWSSTQFYPTQTDRSWHEEERLPEGSLA